MENIDFKNRVETILEEDRRYSFEAYEFINLAVKFTVEQQAKQENRTGRRHVSAVELLDGMVVYAQQQFGPLAAEVLRGWRLYAPADIGHVVFNMVNARLLSRSDEDNESDFNIAYDLYGKLSAPYCAAAGPALSVRAPIIV